MNSRLGVWTLDSRPNPFTLSLYVLSLLSTLGGGGGGLLLLLACCSRLWGL